MARISRVARTWVAIAIWFTGILASGFAGWWNLASTEREADNRLISEAARAAGELANLLALTEWGIDEYTARAAISGAMEDERIYAVKITLHHRTLDGQRRNYLWEPIPWDDEIAENSVQGMNPLVIDGQPVGRVEVWVSARSVHEENALLAWREFYRWLFVLMLWTGALILILWDWGDFRRLIMFFKEKNKAPADDADKLPELKQLKQVKNGYPIDREFAKKYLCKNDNAWLVTAGLFKQTFNRAPALINRLYADGETASLCHLGRILETAAPCLGAEKLAQAAKDMQTSLNHPDMEVKAKSIEDCTRALEDVLNCLGNSLAGTGRQEK